LRGAASQRFTPRRIRPCLITSLLSGRA